MKLLGYLLAFAGGYVVARALIDTDSKTIKSINSSIDKFVGNVKDDLSKD